MGRTLMEVAGAMEDDNIGGYKEAATQRMLKNTAQRMQVS